MALRRTSKTMRTTVENAMADAVVLARHGIKFRGGQGLQLRLQLNGLNAWCKVTVLSLKNCRLGRTGAVRLAEACASFLSASLVALDLERNDIGADGGRALAEALRLNTTLTSFNLRENGLGKGGGRALA